MHQESIEAIIHKAELRNHIISSNVAYAVHAIENDSNPQFRLGTTLRMGLSDDEIQDPNSIAQMAWEYKAWVVGHALADISESISTLLNNLASIDAVALGYSGYYQSFERLGLTLKLKALENLHIDQDYQDALDSITKARNCLIHRHGVVGQKDCNNDNKLTLTWRGIQFSNVTSEGYKEFDIEHRGPATKNQGDICHLLVTGIKRSFDINTRLNIEPNDLSTISWCISGITKSIGEKALDLLQKQ